MAVAKVFKIEFVGGNDVRKELQAIKKDMNSLATSIAKTKAQLNELLKQNTDAAGIKNTTQQLQQQEQQLIKLHTRRKELINTAQNEAAVQQTLNNETEKQVGEYYKLNQQYQAAKKNAQDLAAQYGVESEQALAAAKATAELKQQIIEINNLVKSGGANAQASITGISGSVSNEEAIAAKKAEEQANIDLAKSEESLAAKEAELNAAIESAAASGNQRAQLVKDEAAANDEAAASVDAVQTKYEQFTGTLRDNILVQLENETALASNRAQQKALQKEITEAGSATDVQVEKMASLREEEQLLIETNKALTVTIRNQAKEFIAESGSLDEMQAQLNQLKQSYEALSEAEKNTSFGQELKAEIDSLEPKVKALEADLGDFGRNVGNYPQGYTKAFTVLNNELDKVQGKLIQGNFTGNDLDELARKEAVLKNATEALGKSYSTTAKQQNAFKEAARQIGIEFGTNSEVFQQFTAQVKAGNSEIKAADQAIVGATGSSGKFQKAIDSVYGGIRKLAYIIPGLGIAGIISLLLVPFESLAATFKKFGDNSSKAKGEIDDLKNHAKEMNDVLNGSIQEFAQAASAVEILKINVKLAKDGFLDKNEVIKQYNDGIGKTTGAVTSLNEVEAKLVAAGPAYIRMMFLKAAAQNAATKAAEEAVKAEIEFQEQLRRAANLTAKGQDQQDQQAGAAGLSEFLSSGIKNEADATKKAADQRVKTFNDIAEKFQKEAAEISKKFGFDFFPDGKTGADKLSTALQNQLKLIEEARLRALAIENTATNEIQKERELSFDEEEEHLKKVEAINVDAYNKKISLFEKQKKLNAEEKRTLAEFGEQKSAIELETSRKIADVEKRRFERQQKDLKNELDARLSAIREANTRIQNDTDINNVDKAKFQVETDNQILEAQEDYYNKLLKLNADYNKDASAQAKEGMDSQKKIIENNRKLLFDAAIKDINDGSGKLSDVFQQKLAEATEEILTSNLSPRKQAEALLKLQEDAEDALLANQVARLKREVNEYQKARDQKLITEKEYQDKLTEYKKAEADYLAKSTDKELSAVQKFKNAMKDFGASFLEVVLGIKKYTKGTADDAQKMKDAINDGLQGVKNAITTTYNAYFQREEDQIEKRKQDQLDFLDREKERVLATAQSEEEKAAIERKYQQESLKAEKKAAEEKKKLALKQATIDYAAAAIKTLAQYGFTVAGLVAVAGLSLAYLAQRSAIQNTTYEKGGKPKRKYFNTGGMPMQGGVIGGLPHSQGGTPFVFQGEQYEAEVDELAVIRTKNAPKNKRYTITGNQSQIASALNTIGGGVAFDSGAAIRKMEAGGRAPGDFLRPPTFNTGYYSGEVTRALEDKDRMDRLENMVATVAASVAASDSKPVILNPNAVTKAQDKKRKEVSVGTI